jgi:hypothetical protein
MDGVAHHLRAIDLAVGGRAKPRVALEDRRCLTAFARGKSKAGGLQLRAAEHAFGDPYAHIEVSVVGWPTDLIALVPS